MNKGKLEETVDECIRIYQDEGEEAVVGYLEEELPFLMSPIEVAYVTKQVHMLIDETKDWV